LRWRKDAEGASTLRSQVFAYCGHVGADSVDCLPELLLGAPQRLAPIPALELVEQIDPTGFERLVAG